MCLFKAENYLEVSRYISTSHWTSERVFEDDVLCLCPCDWDSAVPPHRLLAFFTWESPIIKCQEFLLQVSDCAHLYVDTLYGKRSTKSLKC